jgi:hypothetical protein
MFLTVKEASDLTGKSATTIYRLCNKRRNSLYIKKEDNKFFINKDFLLATYPSEEKRTSDIIENGSKETGEPVFLEIEPKIKEEITSTGIPANSGTLKSEAKPITEITPETIENKDDIKINNEIISPVDNNIALETQIPITVPIEDKKPFYKKKEFLEPFIGLSLIVAALVSLLLLFYYNIN